MKFIVALLLTAFLGYVASLFSFTPWWIFAITSLLVALAIHQRGFRAFMSGFWGLFLLWGTYSFIIDLKNNHILSTKIATLLGLGANGVLLVFISALVGGLISGFAALTGSYVRTVRKVRKSINEPGVSRKAATAT